MQPENLSSFLTERLGEPIAAVQPIAHGEWSRAFYVTSASGRELVVRFSARDEDFLKDRWALRFASPRLPMPWVVEVGAVDAGYYAISERAHGEFMEQRDAAAMQRLLPSVFEMLDACRTADLSDSGGFGLWRPDGTAPHATWRDALLAVVADVPGNRTYGWSTELRRSDVGQRAFDLAFRRLETLVDACPNKRYLVHSDLLNFNVLVRDDQISTVLDWGSSLFGDFLWDLAWFTFWQPWYTAWHEVDFRAFALQHYAAIGLDVPNFEARLHCYELAIGLDGLAYQSFAGHWDNLAWTARRLQVLISE